MGTVHKFKRPPKNQQQFRGYKPKRPKPPRGPRWWERSLVMWVMLVALAAILTLSRQLL
jgi:hypothetical protein